MKILNDIKVLLARQMNTKNYVTGFYESIKDNHFI